MLQIFIILICLGLNALISGTEFAFVSISKAKLKRLAEEGQRGAERVLSLRENPERTLSVLQLGSTFIGVIAAAVGGAQMDEWVTPWIMDSFSVPHKLAEFIAIFLFVIPYTYINVVLSELLPKSLALRNPRWVIFQADRWLFFLGKILAPVVFLLEKSTKFSVKLFFSWVKSEEGEAEEKFIPAGGLIRPYMYNLAKMERKSVKDVMVPWEEADKVSILASIDEVKELVLKTKHTRLPIVENSHPLGILQTKEFIDFIEQKDPNWQSLLRPIIHVHETDTLIHALKIMQKERSHLSVVLKDEKGPSGIVTIEDILEEVVGEIYDEDDPTNLIN